MALVRPRRLLHAALACCAAAAAAAANVMLDTDAAGPACGASPPGSACEREDVQLFQRELSVKQRVLSTGIAGGTAAASSAGTSAGPASQCVDVPEGSEVYEDWRGSGKMQRLTAFEDTCLRWNPSQHEQPPRPEGCLGPLEQLVGTWVGLGHAYTYVPTLPFPSMRRQGPTKTATPWYNETLVFTPIIGTAINKGYSGDDHLHPECRVEQALQGVSYTQEIRIGYMDELFQLLHYESGVIMYNVVPGWEENANWTVARMGVVPRGITFHANGNHKLVQEGDVKEQLLQELSAFNLDLLSKDKCMDSLGHIGPPQVPEDVEEPHVFKREPELDPGLADMHDYLLEPIQRAPAVESYTKIDLPVTSISTNSFLHQAAKPSNFQAAMFIESLRDQDGSVKQQLQYAQRLDVEFFQRLDCMTCPGLTRDAATGCYPNVTKHLDECFADNSLDPSCSERPLISWPHVTIGTLTKVA